MCNQYTKSVQKSVEQVYHHKHNKSVAKVYQMHSKCVAKSAVKSVVKSVQKVY